jgi:FKBP-type peptidyl-prolyl cis-trans isomerase
MLLKKMPGDLIRLSENKYWRLLPAILLLIFMSCRNRTDSSVINPGPGKNEMENLNIYFVKKDKERIQSYIERRSLQMKESPTGLWYQVNREGEGDFFKDNDRIVFNYECSLLDGTPCYSSADTGPKEVILGRSEMEAGLNEGFRLLKPGAEAIFILPPYLAYGFVGDHKKIPPRAVVVYNVNILPSKK